MQQGGIGTGGGDIQRGLGLFTCIFGFAIVDFYRLCFDSHVRTDDVVPVIQNAPQCNKFLAERRRRQTGNAHGQGAQVRHNLLCTRIQLKSHVCIRSCLFCWTLRESRSPHLFWFGGLFSILLGVGIYVWARCYRLSIV